MTHILCGPVSVIASGQVTTFHGHPLRFEGVEDWVVEVRFGVDELAPGARVASAYTAEGVVFTLVNFEGVEGRGSAEPVLIGETPKGMLFFHFRAFRHGRSPDHTLHYTFYVGDPEALKLEPLASPDAQE